MVIDVKLSNPDGTEEWLQTDYLFLDERNQIVRYRGNTSNGIQLIEILYEKLNRKYGEDGFIVHSDDKHAVYVPQEFSMKVRSRQVVPIPYERARLGNDR